MVRDYLNVRATGGAVASFPYRGGLGEGGCFFASFFAPKKVRNKYVK